MYIYIIWGVVIIIIIYALIMFNTFVSLDNKVIEAFSTMDVYLKKRWDLIPNLVEIVKFYARYEQDTITEIIDLRNNNYDEMDVNQKIKTNMKLSNDISKIMILKESYPDLKANLNFKDLSDKLIKIEDDIANSRKYYNGTVRIFNNKVEMFPNNILAFIFGYKSKKMFEIKNKERDNIKVEL